MSKFELQHAESLYMEGYAVHIKSAVRVLQGDAYLTSERFVYAKKSLALLGPLFMHFVKGKTIVFEFPISTLSSIHQEKHGLVKKHILTVDTGETYAVMFGVNKASREKWISSLIQVMKETCPDLEVKEIGERIDFVKQ